MKKLDFTHDSMINVMTLFSLLYIKHIKVYYARFPAYNYIYMVFLFYRFFLQILKFPFRGYSGSYSLLWWFHLCMYFCVYCVHNLVLLNGLIIPSHILLSDKNPRGNVVKTHERALLLRVFWSHLREGFRQTAIYDQEWLIPIMTISVYNNIFNYLSWIILILPQITGFSTSRLGG